MVRALSSGLEIPTEPPTKAILGFVKQAISSHIASFAMITSESTVTMISDVAVCTAERIVLHFPRLTLLGLDSTFLVSALAGIGVHGYGNPLCVEVPHHVD